jgi:hypothetical protein
MKRLIGIGFGLGLFVLAGCAADIGDPGPEQTDDQTHELDQGSAPAGDPAVSPEGKLGQSATATDPGGPTPNPWQPELYDDPNGPTPNPWAEGANSGAGTGTGTGTGDEQGAGTGTQGGSKTGH